MKPPAAILTSAALVGAATLVAAGLSAAPASAAAVHESKVSTGLPQRVERIVVSDEIGQVVIRTGARHQVVATKRWNRTEPKLSITTTADGVVSIKASCPSSDLVDGVVVGDGGCSVDVVAVLPATADVRVVTEVGDIAVRDISGTQSLTSSTGSIRAARATGTAVSARTDVGDVTLGVPRGSYRYVARSDDGTVTVRGIGYRAAATHSLRAVSSSGDVAIAGY